MREGVNVECLDSDASHIGPADTAEKSHIGRAAAKEQVISGQVGPLKTRPDCYSMATTHTEAEILQRKLF